MAHPVRQCSLQPGARHRRTRTRCPPARPSCSPTTRRCGIRRGHASAPPSERRLRPLRHSTPAQESRSWLRRSRPPGGIPGADRRHQRATGRHADGGRAPVGTWRVAGVAVPMTNESEPQLGAFPTRSRCSIAAIVLLPASPTICRQVPAPRRADRPVLPETGPTSPRSAQVQLFSEYCGQKQTATSCALFSQRRSCSAAFGLTGETRRHLANANYRGLTKEFLSTAARPERRWP